VDIDEKKVELFRIGLYIQLQDRMNLFPSLTYKTLASAAIDQKGTLRACAEAKERNRMRVMPGPSRGGSGGASPKYCLVYTPPTGQSC
jgi:hypothetical protein